MRFNSDTEIADYLESHSVPEPNSGCQLWLAAGASQKDYGHFRVRIAKGKYEDRYAHRESYRLAHGPIPPGLMVMHACDTPQCINPDHLSVGTHTANQFDRSVRSRVRDRNLPSHVSYIASRRAYLFSLMKDRRVMRFYSRDLEQVLAFRASCLNKLDLGSEHKAEVRA